MARKHRETIEYERSTTVKGARFFGKIGGWGGAVTGLLASALPVLGILGLTGTFTSIAALPFIATSAVAVAGIGIGIAALTAGGFALAGAIYGFTGGSIGGGVLGALAGATKRIFGYGPEQVKQREFETQLVRAEALGRNHARQAIGMQMGAMMQEGESPALPSKVQDILAQGPNKGAMADAVAREKSEAAKAQGLGA